MQKFGIFNGFLRSLFCSPGAAFIWSIMQDKNSDIVNYNVKLSIFIYFKM